MHLDLETDVRGVRFARDDAYHVVADVPIVTRRTGAKEAQHVAGRGHGRFAMRAAERARVRALDGLAAAALLLN